jgi:hypothetical protein
MTCFITPSDSEKQLLKDPGSILGTRDCMSLDVRVVVNLVIVSADKRFIAKEVDLLECLFFDVAETVRFVPALGEHVERNLPADRVG